MSRHAMSDSIDVGASMLGTAFAAHAASPHLTDSATTTISTFGSRPSSFKLSEPRARKTDPYAELPPRLSPASEAPVPATPATAGTCAHPAASTLHTPKASPAAAHVRGRQLDRSSSTEHVGAVDRSSRGSSPACPAPALSTHSAATASSVTASPAASGGQEPETPFAAAFYTAAAAAAWAGTASGPDPIEGLALFPARLTASCVTAPSVAALVQPTASAPACTPTSASPLVSPLRSFRIRAPDAAASNGSAAAAGAPLSPWNRTSASGLSTPQQGAAVPPSATLRTVSERRIQRLLHKIDSVCSSSTTTSPAASTSSAPRYGDRDSYQYGADGARLDERGRESPAYLPSPPPPPVSWDAVQPPEQPRRLDEQSVQELMLMLSATPLPGGSALSGSSDAAAGASAAAAAPAAASASTGAGSTISPPLASELDPSAWTTSRDGTWDGTSTEGTVALMVKSADGCGAAGGLSSPAREGPTGEQRIRLDGRRTRSCDVGRAVTCIIGDEEETVEEREQVLELSLRQLVASTARAALSESRSVPVDVVGKRTAPGAGARRAAAGRGDADAVAVPYGGGGGAAAAGNDHPADDEALALLGTSNGNGSGYGSSLSESTDKELSARQLVLRSSVERGLGGLRPSGSSSCNLLSASLSASVTLAPHGAVDANPSESMNALPYTPKPASASVFESEFEQQVVEQPRSRRGGGGAGGSRRRAWSSSDSAGGAGSGNSSDSDGGGRADGLELAPPVRGRSRSKRDVDGASDGGGEALLGFLDLTRSRSGAAAEEAVADAPGPQVGREPGSAGQAALAGPGATAAQRSAALQLQQQLQQQPELQKGVRNAMTRRAELRPRPPERPRSGSGATPPMEAWAAPPPSPPPSPPPVPHTGGPASLVPQWKPPPLDVDTDPPSSFPVEPPPRSSGGGGNDSGSGAVLTSSPLQARLALGRTRRSNRSLSEPLSVMRDSPARSFKVPSPPQPPPPLFGKSTTVSGGASGCGDDDDDDGSGSSEVDFKVRRGGLTAPGGPRLASVLETPPTPTAAAAAAPAAPAGIAGIARSSSSSASAALEAAANLVALIDEDLSRGGSGAVGAAAVGGSTARSRHNSFGPGQTSHTSPALLYPHPPPMSPTQWSLSPQSPQSPLQPHQAGGLFGAASVPGAIGAAADATAVLHRTLGGRSQRRLNTPQHSLKHGSLGCRLETLEEEGQQRPALAVPAADQLSASDGGGGATSTGSGSTGSGGGGGGGGGGPWNTISGGSLGDGSRLHAVTDRNRRSTSSTSRFLHRRRRLTGEPGDSSSSSDSSDNSGSEDSYLQSLFRPMRLPVADSAAAAAAAAAAGGPTPEAATAERAFGGALRSLAAANSARGISKSGHAHTTAQPPPPPPPPPQQEQQPQQPPEQLWARRTSGRALGRGATSFPPATPGTGVTASVCTETSTASAVQHTAPIRRSLAFSTPAATAPPTATAQQQQQPPTLPTRMSGGPHPATGAAAAAGVERVGGRGVAGRRSAAVVAAEGDRADGGINSSGQINIDTLKRDLERLLAR